MAPVVALMQWKHEIETHAEGFKVYLWHGSTKVKSSELKKYDVVSIPGAMCLRQSLMEGALIVRNARSRFPSTAERV